MGNRRRIKKPAGCGFEVHPDYQGMSRRAAEIILSGLRGKPDLLLCASAGGTPSRLYQLLAEEYGRTPELFPRLRVLQIDEWAGIPADHPASCRTDLQRKLVGPLHVTGRRAVFLNSNAADPEAECQRVSDWLAANGPIDICILGLGLNGHVAMNEPADCAQPSAHVASLSASSRRHGMLEHFSPKPRYGLTLGMGQILQSRAILLLVSGATKAAALDRLRDAQVSPRFPASFLWLHGDAVVLCDRAAAGILEG